VAFALQPHVPGQLVRIHARTFVFVVMLAGVTAGGIAAPRSAAFPSKVRVPPDPAGQSREVPVDFNGNEVRQAIARYKVDPTGAVYEEHSPETEVPRLAPPKG
jgi:hypothetical protein